MNIDDLVRLAADALNMPESMVRKSAEARSKAAGRTVEQLLGEWAGVDPASEAPPRAETPTPTQDTSATPTADTPATPAPAEAPATPAPAAASAPATAVDDAALLTKAAASQGLPEAMTKRSAAARAKAEGRTVEEVLAEWAGVELSAASAAPTSTPAASADEPAAPAAAAPAAAAAPSIDAADLLAKAAAAQGLPEAMTKRSAAARAKAEGKTTDQILAEWAGVEAPPAGAAPAAAPAAAAAAASAPVAAEPAAQVEVIAEESDDAPVVSAHAERELVTPSGAFPRWLAVLFVAVPMFAVTYASFLPNGPNCGDAGSLEVDPVTGIAVSCDGSEFGQEELDFFAIGAEVYGASCAVCHGPTGGGVANFPPFIDGALLATFPEGTCAAHTEWVTLATTGWPEPTYGANNKPVGGLGVVMPGFGDQLTEDELRSVALYERVQFGGLPLEGALADCGLGG